MDVSKYIFKFPIQILLINEADFIVWENVLIGFIPINYEENPVFIHSEGKQDFPHSYKNKSNENIFPNNEIGIIWKKH